MQEQENKSGLSSSAKIILLCTIILVVFLSFAMFFMWSYLQELSASPLTVGARKIAQANNANDVMCSCNVLGSSNQNIGFYFNTTTIWDTPKGIFPY